MSLGLRKLLRGLPAPLLAVLLLELASRTGLVDTVLFPAPSTIAVATFDAAPEIAAHALTTLLLAALSFVVAFAFAVPLGLLLGRSAGLHSLLRPSVDGLRTLPAAAIIPVAILLLGIDQKMRLAVVAFGTAWPILLSTMDAVHLVRPIMRDTARTLQLTPIQSFSRVLLPAALPGILTGARIAISIALILAVTVEMIAGDSGLGFFVLDTERSFRFPEMYGGVFVLAVMGATVNGVLLTLERTLLYWQRDQDW